MSGSDTGDTGDDDARVLAGRRRQSRAAMATVVVVAVCAWVVHFIEIESVMATGPLLACAGLVAVVAGARAEVLEAKLLGAFSLTLTVTLFLAVLGYDWSPARAERPFAIVGTLALAVILALAGRGWRRSAPPEPVLVSTATMMPVPEAKATDTAGR